MGSLKIGNFVMIGPNCNIITANHGFADHAQPMMFQDAVPEPVKIEDDVWLGSNVVILPNVTVGRGAIIGANSVVTRDVPAFAIVGGVPTKVIRYRFPEEKMEELKSEVFRSEDYL